MNFEAQLDKYAELVVRAGLNVQQGQEVLIEADLEAAPLVRLAAKHAWAAGAGEGFTLRITPTLWMREPVAEAVGRIPSAAPAG